jgi:hypothetical protein
VARAPDRRPGDGPGPVRGASGLPAGALCWIDPASAPRWLVPEGFGEVGSVMVTPLPGHGVAAGVLMLRRRTQAAGVRLHLDNRKPPFERLLEVTATLTHLTQPPVPSDIGQESLPGGSA